MDRTECISMGCSGFVRSVYEQRSVQTAKEQEQHISGNCTWTKPKLIILTECT